MDPILLSTEGTFLQSSFPACFLHSADPSAALIAADRLLVPEVDVCIERTSFALYVTTAWLILLEFGRSLLHLRGGIDWLMEAWAL